MIDIIKFFLHNVPINNVMAHLQDICKYDRYQASIGIEQAAYMMAEKAESAGLSDVSIDFYPANGETQWWSFEAPLSWTPSLARIVIYNDDKILFDIDHHLKPFSIATYSAPTPVKGINTQLVNIGTCENDLDLLASVIVIDRNEFSKATLDRISHAGAAGFITDAFCQKDASGTEYNGRIELHQATPLFGFSVTTKEIKVIQESIKKRARAQVSIEIDRSARMPVVSGLIPGNQKAREIWLSGHLCHPGPGANDNASGAASLLGIASLLSKKFPGHLIERGSPIRFIWGPEFTGTAAMLYQRIMRYGKAGLPISLINLDMVGEHQSVCGGAFIVERNPDFILSLINPVAEYITEKVFSLTSNHYGKWEPSPFLGFSDHALAANFSYPGSGCSAIQLCHSTDLFNHSAGDTIDKVSPIEMQRSITVGASLACILATEYSIPEKHLLKKLTGDWCLQQEKQTSLIMDKYREQKFENWKSGLKDYRHRINKQMYSLASHSYGILPEIKPDKQPRGGVEGRWEGPLNVRNLIAVLPPATKNTILELIAEDKLHYSLLMQFAMRCDGQMSQEEIIKETSYSLQRPLNEHNAKIIFSALVESGYVNK